MLLCYYHIFIYVSYSIFLKIGGGGDTQNLRTRCHPGKRRNCVISWGWDKCEVFLAALTLDTQTVVGMSPRCYSYDVISWVGPCSVGMSRMIWRNCMRWVVVAIQYRLTWACQCKVLILFSNTDLCWHQMLSTIDR